MQSVSSEPTRYLVDKRHELKILDEYPIIREMFLKFYTQLPTSAIVERMFNFAGMLDDPKRNRILPTNFEKSILIKSNAVYARDKPNK